MSLAVPATRARNVILEYFSAVDAGDVAAALMAFNNDVTYERPGYAPIVGLDALATFYRSTRVIREGRHFIEGLLTDGVRASAWGSFEGIDRKGEPLSERWADIYRFRRGRISDRRTHFFRAAI
jgi:ketosteroid isomerase-like protein